MMTSSPPSTPTQMAQVPSALPLNRNGKMSDALGTFRYSDICCSVPPYSTHFTPVGVTRCGVATTGWLLGRPGWSG